MRYCSHCGKEIMDAAVICVHCGCPVNNSPVAVTNRSHGMETAVKVFMVLSSISICWLIIPLAWCIPMTISVFRKYRDGQPVSTGFKICVLLFVGIIPGILMLCMSEQYSMHITDSIVFYISDRFKMYLGNSMVFLLMTIGCAGIVFLFLRTISIVSQDSTNGAKKIPMLIILGYGIFAVIVAWLCVLGALYYGFNNWHLVYFKFMEDWF